MTKIYFNRWFSTVYHYMNAIRENEDGAVFEIHASHPDPGHMSLQGADKAVTEPVLEGQAYAEYCAEYCRKHAIDVFIPRLHMLDIVQHAGLFDQIGTKILACRDADLLEDMLRKDKFYENAMAKGVVDIPDYRVVNTVEQFEQAYSELTGKGHRVCIKPAESEGGLGFRIVGEPADPLADLYGYVTPLLPFEDIRRRLSRAERFPDLMVMELLEGREYSIDCLADASGELRAAVPRRKIGGRVRMLENNARLLEIAGKVAVAYRIPYNFNIQVKYSGETPKLLEINPRMSGGLHLSCLSGVNFPYLAVKSALGGEIGPLQPQYGVLASHIEQPVVLRTAEPVPER